MSNRRAFSFRPRLEPLDERCVPTVFTVTTNAATVVADGQVSLREAIRAANLNAPVADAPAGSSGLDTIQFAASLNGQTISFTDIPAFSDISEDLKIIGPGADRLTISGSNSVPIFLIDLAEDGGVDVTISGLTLVNGRYHLGGAIHNRGNLTVADAVLSSNFSTIDGGAIYNTGTLTIADSTIAGNVAINHGGGIYNTGTLTIANSTISSNIANSGDEFGGGGGIYSAAGTLTLNNSTISGNNASSGGGITCDGVATITNTTIAANSAADHGGGIDNFADLTVDGSIITGNTANGVGGGVLISSTSSSLTITNSTVAGNSAGNGGGIYDLGSLTVANCTIAGQRGDERGRRHRQWFRRGHREYYRGREQRCDRI